MSNSCVAAAQLRATMSAANDRDRVPARRLLLVSTAQQSSSLALLDSALSQTSFAQNAPVLVGSSSTSGLRFGQRGRTDFIVRYRHLI